LKEKENMIKLEAVDELVKAVGGLASHFHKAAEHHDALHKHHTEMSSYAKSKHDAADDADVHKAFLGKVAEHHAAKAALHKAHHEHLKAMAAECDKSLKAVGTEGTVDITKTNATPAAASAAAPAAAADPVVAASEGVKGMMDTTVAALVQKALSSLKDDPKVAEEIQKIVLEQVQAALGGKLIPSDVRGVLPAAVTLDPRPNLIPRAGQSIAAAPVSVDPELADLFEVSNT
jgi:hypothetical protein